MKTIALAAVVAALVCSINLLAAPKAEKLTPVYAMTYCVADLPVWRTNLKETSFSPEVLIKYLEASVDPESWKKDGVIRVDNKRCGLIIAQTQANHEAIADALQSMRTAYPGEEVEERVVR